MGNFELTEYGMGGEISTKGDVYSYGILILEMITGKRPTDPQFTEGLNLHNYAKMSLPNRVMEIVDPMLLNNIEENASNIAANDNQRRLASNGNIEESFISMVKIGVACSMESAQDRIDITSVVRELRSIEKILRNDICKCKNQTLEAKTPPVATSLSLSGVFFGRTTLLDGIVTYLFILYAQSPGNLAEQLGTICGKLKFLASGRLLHRRVIHCNDPEESNVTRKPSDIYQFAAAITDLINRQRRCPDYVGQLISNP
ncbi:hypothetical protein LguiB_006303 [Lonicera macranthoides]